MEGFIYMLLKHHDKYVRLGFYYFYIILNEMGELLLYLGIKCLKIGVFQAYIPR